MWHEIESTFRHYTKEKPVWVFLFTALLVFLTRVPFIAAGYGLDSDSWWVANAARWIATNGAYKASRLPGYPVHELVSSLLWQGGPIALNGITAAMSAIGVTFFVFVLLKLNIENSLISGIALALVPVIYIASTSTIDYMWAFAFFMGSLFFLISEKPFLAGLFLGIAIGCRVTSIFLLIPFGVYILANNWKTEKSYLDLLIFLLSTLCIGVAAFSPVFTVYGKDFLSFVETERTNFQIFRIATAGVWSKIGTAIIMLGFFYMLFAWKKAQIVQPNWQEKFLPILLTSISSLLFYGILFLKLPVEAGYLIPAIPFCLILLNLFTSRGVYHLLCIGILFSAFVNINQSGIVPGRIIADHTERVERMQFIEQTLEQLEDIPDNSVVVAGDWHPLINNELFSKPNHIVFVYGLSKQKTEKIIAADRMIYCLPGQEYLIKFGKASGNIISIHSINNIEDE